MFYDHAIEENLPPPSEMDQKQQTALWQQNQLCLPDSGFVSAAYSEAASISSKQGPDEIEFGIPQPQPQLGQPYDLSMPIHDRPVSDIPPNLMPPQGTAMPQQNVTAMANLINYQDDSDITTHAIPELIKFLEADDEVVIAHASRVVMDFSRKNDFRQNLSNNQQMMAALINVLRTSKDENILRSCAGAIHNLSHFHNGLNAIFNLQGIPVLCKLLQHPREIVKYVAVATLHNLLLSHKDAKNAVRAAGGIEIMTSLLQYDNDKFLAVCIDCLQMLSYGHKQSKLVVLENGAPVELIRIMQFYSYEKLLYTTTRLLKVLSVCPQNKPLLVQGGCVQVLASHLASSSDRLVCNCLWTLRNLSDMAYKCDGLEHLLQMLCQLLTARKVEMVECAVGILSNLLCMNAKNKITTCDIGGVECLVRCVAEAGNRDSIAEMGICALRHLTNRHSSAEMAQATILAVGGLPVIMKSMQPSSKWSLIKAAIGLIRNLALYGSGNAIQLREHGAFQRVVHIFQQVFKDMQMQVQYEDAKVMDVAESCIGALQVLCRDSSNRSLVTRQNVTPMFIQLLHSSSEGIQRAAAGVLGEIAGDKEGMQEILAGGAVQVLSQLSVSHNEGVATNAAIVLSRLPSQNSQSFNFSSSLFPEVLPWENNDDPSAVPGQPDPVVMQQQLDQQGTPIPTSNEVDKVMFNFNAL